MVTPSPEGRKGAWQASLLAAMAAIVFSVVTFDQWTKWLVRNEMRLHESIPVIPDVFHLTYIRNSGAAFGIMAGSQAGFRMIFFGLTSVIALVLLGTIYSRLSSDDRLGQGRHLEP